MSHIWVVDTVGGSAVQLTSGDFHAGEPAWSPRGDQIAFVSRPTPNANERLLSDLYVVSADGGIPPRKLVTNEGPDDAPRWSPDGSLIAYLSSDRRQSSGGHRSIRVVPVSEGEPRVITRGFDYSAGQPHWTPDGRTLYFATATRTESHIYTVPVGGGTVRAVTSGAALLDSIDISKDGQRLLYIREDMETPDDLWISAIDGTSPKRLTNLNPQLSEVSLAESEVIRWKGAEDREIEGILVKPLGYQSGKRYPLIVEAHGGPHGRMSVRFNPMWQYFAANGFMVLAPNFHGSGGYSQEFVDSDRNDWGGKDYIDIMNGVDHVIDVGLADPDRLGIEGWSYGGFMTSWIIGHTNRFKAAIVGAGVTNLRSFYGTTDIQRFIEWEYYGFPWDNVEAIRDHSPITFAPKARTPTLILHGNEDIRVPVEQAKQLYMVLKKVGTPVEFVRYPREGHGLREPSHQRDRYERSLAWFERYLGQKATTSLNEPTGF
jgi:dipeptidyl aminopeptidase/acylaminoacyl peptidase